MIGLIVARSRNNVIGKGGRIPWRIEGEQKQFKELTTGNIVIMGRKSYEEIGHPLPGRLNIIVSKSRTFEGQNLMTAVSLHEALELAKGDGLKGIGPEGSCLDFSGRDIFIAGGYGIYKEALPYVDVMYITEIEMLVEDGDTFFPDFDEDAFEKTSGEIIGKEIKYKRTVYKRKQIEAKKMNTKIRIANAQDAAALLDIYSYYVKNTAISFEYEVPSLEEFTKRIQGTLKNYPYLIAEVDGKAAGYVYAGRFSPRAAYDWTVETSIYIGKDFRHQGLGKLLYQKLEKILAAQNVTNLYAGIASPFEEDPYLTNKSELFHTAIGYKRVARFSKIGNKFDRWYDLIYMEKIIGQHKSPQPALIPFSELKDKEAILDEI